ncbi:hypothetical protein KUF71_012208 [Frankliniella fusca]|uniref:Uncharacterized protein n=1 Tax=Frankliniella fusca TaxID=407009 RepID=A0AAE1LML0_9NEOP|nr:hypothetical protein KUF71_012208 [Frankliniella fusca]
MKVLQGTIHQGNNFIFPVYYGVQCCSASVVACAYGLIHEPNLWTARDIDACVHLGTNLHAKSCPQNHNGFLFPHEIHETFTLPNNVDVYLQAAKEAKFIGPIHNIEGFGDEIVSALTTYFQTSRCGILTCNEYSFAILSADDKYWIFDSHAKNMEGKCDSEGFAVLISFSCINELVLYLQQNFNNFSTYSITEIKFDMQIPVFDLLGDSNQNQPGLPVSNHIGDSNQNQPGLCVFDHLGDSNQNQPGLPVFDHLGDSNQNQPGLPVFDHLGDSNQNQPGLSVSNHIGDSNQNRPGFTWPLGGSSQNQPGSDVEKDSLKNQPHLLTCPLGDSIQNHPGTDYKQDSKKNLPNSFTGPIGDSSLSQPNTMSHEPQPKIQLTSSKSQPEKTTNLHPTHLKSMQISKNMNKKRKMQIKLENSRMEKAKRTRLDINDTLANETVQESKESSPVKLQKVLQGLTQLEERLLAVRQPFMKIIELSKYAGPQYGLKGSCVNVPTDLNSTVSILPRNLTDSETILIKLQRRMEDKVPYSFDLIRPERVYKAAKYLVGTEIYKKHNITLDSDWLHNVQSPVEVITVNNEDNLTENINILENSLTNSIDKNIQTNNSQPNLPHIKPIQKPKHKKFEDIFFDTDSNASSSSNELSDSETETGNHETMVMPDILPDHITNDLGLKIAPGEGQVPISLLQDEDVDILTYPSIYCGKARHFQHKLTDSQLRKFELKSSDRRAAKHIPKLFMSFCKSRLRRFVNRISIAMRKKKNGKSLTAAQILQPNGLDQLIQEDEGYKILDEDRSSPAYWCQKTKEAMAMIRQYGPAHIFATLTSAEVYWHELITILIKINNEQELTEEEVKLLPKLEKINLVKQDPVTCAWLKKGGVCTHMLCFGYKIAQLSTLMIKKVSKNVRHL